MGRTTKTRRRTEYGLLTVQCLALTLAAITFALLPPDKGPVLLIPLRSHSATRMIGEDLKLLGAGRLPGSLIVTGERPSFTTALFGHAVLILPAVPLLCGSSGNLENNTWTTPNS